MEKLKSAPIQSDPFSLKQGEDKTTASGVAVELQRGQGGRGHEAGEETALLSVSPDQGASDPHGVASKKRSCIPTHSGNTCLHPGVPMSILSLSWIRGYLGKSR